MAGIHPRLWKQAQLDNPDPEKLLPVPIIGFGDIRWRTKCQETETKVHTAVLDKIASDIADLKRNNSETVAKIAEYKQKVMDLEHRVLKVLISIIVSLPDIMYRFVFLIWVDPKIQSKYEILNGSAK